MIGLTSRPPQTRDAVFHFHEGVITPNNAFFVRYHLADIPLNIDRINSRWRSGQGRSSAQAVVEGNQEACRVELVASINVGNAADFSIRASPAANGPTGAMGMRAGAAASAKTVLDKAGVQQGASRSLLMDGRTGQRQDAGLRQGARHRPRRDGEVMLAYGMNDEVFAGAHGFRSV